MPFYSGGELYVHLENSKTNFRFPEKRVKFYAGQILLALEFLHGKGILYRDLKPENVIMDEEGNVVLTDFGLSKWCDDQKDECIVGTFKYLAPEIFR